ncbi:hypothetical protein uav_023 [Pseudomonas phage UAVern]|uniref:Uncharacterized protein n=1 Tax=Pseudomonas phage UAVern TaxID=2856997 RepID=A0A975YYH9_9CAUD|nr:hypothetical protein uav_023 [Pseudomonas phage UAVern]
MKQVIVFALAFFLTGVAIWLCFAFISTIFNPMLWNAPGRLIFVILVFFFGILAGICASCTYEESVQKSRR